MTGLVRCPKGHIVGECRDGAFVVQMRRRRVVYRSEKAEYLKKAYPPGTRIVLNSMGDDPRPIEGGTSGTVKVVDDIGTVHCEFDSGRSLGLIDGEDDFRALTAQELAEEETAQGAVFRFYRRFTWILQTLDNAFDLPPVSWYL